MNEATAPFPFLLNTSHSEASGGARSRAERRLRRPAADEPGQLGGAEAHGAGRSKVMGPLKSHMDPEKSLVQLKENRIGAGKQRCSIWWVNTRGAGVAGSVRRRNGVNEKNRSFGCPWCVYVFSFSLWITQGPTTRLGIHTVYI